MLDELTKTAEGAADALAAVAAEIQRLQTRCAELEHENTKLTLNLSAANGSLEMYKRTQKSLLEVMNPLLPHPRTYIEALDVAHLDKAIRELQARAETAEAAKYSGGTARDTLKLVKDTLHTRGQAFDVAEFRERHALHFIEQELAKAPDEELRKEIAMLREVISSELDKAGCRCEHLMNVEGPQPFCPVEGCNCRLPHQKGVQLYGTVRISNLRDALERSPSRWLEERERSIVGQARAAITDTAERAWQAGFSCGCSGHMPVYPNELAKNDVSLLMKSVDVAKLLGVGS